MKLVRPTVDQPKNVVQFITSPQMTSYDVKNYLEKIYSVPVIEVKDSIATGKILKMHYVLRTSIFFCV